MKVMGLIGGMSWESSIECYKIINQTVRAKLGGFHSHDASALSKAVLEIERAAFFDGHYLAFAIRTCNLCKDCAFKKGNACPTPEKIRPCDSSFGIDVYRTARNLRLPREVLQNKNEVQNRYVLCSLTKKGEADENQTGS